VTTAFADTVLFRLVLGDAEQVWMLNAPPTFPKHGYEWCLEQALADALRNHRDPMEDPAVQKLRNALERCQ